MMNITKVTPITGEVIETDLKSYERYGPDCWYVRIGEALEPVFNCEELEEAYQRYKA